MVTAVSFLFTKSFRSIQWSNSCLYVSNVGVMDRSYEKPTRLSARSDSAIGCRVCARDGEEPLALGT